MTMINSLNDAVIDFPMRKRLVAVCKGFAPPSELAAHFDYRRQVLKTVVSSHGAAGRYYITFLDNHDLNDRELLVVANTNTQTDVTVHVAVDYNLNPETKVWRVLFSTNPNPSVPAPTASQGTYRTVKVGLKPMEA